MRSSFSKSDLIAVCAAGFLLLLLVPVALAQQAELDKRKTCATNIQKISQSVHAYSSVNNRAYPCVPSTSATTYDVMFKPETGGKTQKDATAAMFKAPRNNPMACLWLLVLSGDLTPKQFLCPSDTITTKAAEVQSPEKDFYVNFQDAKNFSYSMAYPWMTRDGKVGNGAMWKPTTSATIPLISDIAPYLGTKAKPGEIANRPAGAPANAPVNVQWAVTQANSPNHQFVGQNVAYADSHVEWKTSPAVGENKDSIWGIRKSESAADEIPIEAGQLDHSPGGFDGNYDVVMVPTRDAKGNLK